VYCGSGRLGFHLTGPFRADRDDLIGLGENRLGHTPSKRRIQGSQSRTDTPLRRRHRHRSGTKIRVAGVPARQLSLAACT
jgi:hypothetical protein